MEVDLEGEQTENKENAHESSDEEDNGQPNTKRQRVQLMEHDDIKAELKEFHVQQHAELKASLASGKGEAAAHAATIFAEKANQHLA